MNVQKIRKTLFWGVRLDPCTVFCNEEIKHVLNRYPQVVPLKNLHVTLLYVGRMTDSREDVIMPFKYRMCTIVCTSIGFNDDAIVLRVESLRYDDDDDQSIIDPERIYHVTLALRESIKAKDSIKVLNGEGFEMKLASPITLSGPIIAYK